MVEFLAIVSVMLIPPVRGTWINTTGDDYHTPEQLTKILLDAGYKPGQIEAYLKKNWPK